MRMSGSALRSCGWPAPAAVIWTRRRLDPLLFGPIVVWTHCCLDALLFERIVVWTNCCLDELLFGRIVVWKQTVRAPPRAKRAAWRRFYSA